MKQIAVATLLLTLLTTSTLYMMVRTVHAPPGGMVIEVGPGEMCHTLREAVQVAHPNDEIHIFPGHLEVLESPLVIDKDNLWIIGGPSNLAPMPSIHLEGNWIQIVSQNVYITGLMFHDTSGASPMGITLDGGSSGCCIRNNVIAGGLLPGSVGINVNGSSGNLIAVNDIDGWDVGIDVSGPGATSNRIMLNFIDISTSTLAGAGVRVGGGATMNHVFWNHIIGLSDWVGGLGQELWDTTPGNPVNFFDDGMQTSSWGRGNYESSWGSGGGLPYQVRGPGMNGWIDAAPLPFPIGQLIGDSNLDGEVDIFDAIRLSNDYGQMWYQFGWTSINDWNHDGEVDLYDAMQLAYNFRVHY